MVHGFGSSFDLNWRQNGWADLLADAGREVIGVDLLGHGQADKPHDPDAYRDLHAGVAARLPEGDAPVDAVGFSLGAMTLLRLAASAPGRIARLAVLGVGENVFRTEGNEAILRAVAGEAVDDTDIVARVFAGHAELPGQDREALAACLRAGRPLLTPAALAQVTCPVLVVLGDRDFAGPAQPLVDALPDARLVTLPGVDHFATPKAFAAIDAVLQFLEV
jgi:pimeloyl-ACP methyl ester carboxylesterase